MAAASEDGKQLIEHLSIDLRALSTETKKKHPQVKDVRVKEYLTESSVYTGRRNGIGESAQSV
jgi:hypothetical protein